MKKELHHIEMDLVREQRKEQGFFDGRFRTRTGKMKKYERRKERNVRDFLTGLEDY